MKFKILQILLTFSIFNGSLELIQKSESRQLMCKDATNIGLEGDSQMKSTSSFINYIRGNTNKLLVPLESGNKDDFNDYVKSLIPISTPFIVLSGLTLLTFIISLCCICCSRKNNNPSYNKILLQIITLVIILSMSSIIGLSIYGIVQASLSKQSIINTSCEFYKMYDDGLYGDPSQKWYGVSTLFQDIKIIIGQFDDNYKEINDNMNNHDKLVAETDGVQNYLQQLQVKSYQDSQVASPDPNSTQQIKLNVSQQWLASYKSFIQFLGQTRVITDQFYDIYNYMLKVNVDNIQSQLNQANEPIDKFQVQLKDIDVHFSDATPVITDVASWVKIGFIIIFSVFLVISILSLFGIIALISFKIISMHIINQITWVLTSIFVMIAFILAASSFILSVVTFEGCGAYSDSLSSIQNFKQYSYAFGGPQVVNQIDLCFFQTNDTIINKFGLTDLINSMYEIEQNVSLIYQVAYPFINQPFPETQVIQDINQSLIDPDLQTVQYTDNNNAQNILSQSTNISNCLNTYQQQMCTIMPSQDTFQFNIDKCKQNQFQIKPGSESDFIGCGMDSCVIIDQSLDINKRADIIQFQNCQKINDKTYKSVYISYYNSLSTYKKQADALMLNIRNDLMILESQNANIYSQYKQMLNILNQTLDIMDQITSNQTGIANNLECTIFKNSFSKFQKSFCNDLSVSINQLSIIIFVCSCISFISNFLWFYIRNKLKWYIQQKVLDEESSNSSDYKPFNQQIID